MSVLTIPLSATHGYEPERELGLAVSRQRATVFMHMHGIERLDGMRGADATVAVWQDVDRLERAIARLGSKS